MEYNQKGCRNSRIIIYHIRVVFQQSGWHEAPRTNTYGGRRFLQTTLSIASQALHLQHVATVRASKEIAYMRAWSNYVDGEILAWRRGVNVGEMMHFSRGQRLWSNISGEIVGTRAWGNKRGKCFVGWGLLCTTLIARFIKKYMQRQTFHHWRAEELDTISGQHWPRT